MIILYEYTETAFTNNGLGCLNDATSCVVSETLNGEYELEIEYPVNGIHYSDIQLRRIIFAKPNSYDREQPFRIYSISKPIGGLVTVNAEHISYDMSGLPVRGAIEHYAWYVKDVFDHIKNNSVYPCPFTFSSDITEEKKAISLSKPRSVKAFLGTDEGLLSLFGGEWEFDRYNAILHKERGQNRGVSIEYGKNLTDVTQDEACSEMYTAVYPYYYREDDGLQRLNEDVVKILDTTYNNVCVLDLTSEFDEMPTQDQLRAKTQEYIKDNKLGEPKVSLKVSFIKNPEVIEALQDVRLGDTVGVKFIKIGVNTTSRCINYEFNVLTEQYNSIGLGEPTKTIVDTMTSTSIRIDEANSAINDTQDNLDDTKEDLTDEIGRATGAEGALSTRITKTEEGLETEVTRALGAESDMSTRISQSAHSVSISASGSGNTAGITIALYDENGKLIDTTKTANITITGFVSFQDLSTAGQTTINGDNITTGTISANVIDTENFVAKNGNFTKSFNVEIPISNLKNFVIRAQSDELCFIGREEYDSGLGGNMIYGIFFQNNKAYYAGDSTTGEIAIKDDIPDMSNYAKKTDIPNMSNYAKKTDIKVTGFSGDGIQGVYNSIQMNGTVIKGSKISYDDLKKKLSDERLKREISSITNLAIEDFYMNLIPTRHKYENGVGIGEDGKYQFGVIAQWTEKDMIDHAIDPDSYSIICKSKPLADTDEAKYTAGDDVYRVDYDQFHALHIYMIQKQQKEIEQLKSDNFALKGELDILKQRLKRLEEKLC